MEAGRRIQGKKGKLWVVRVDSAPAARPRAERALLHAWSPLFIAVMKPERVAVSMVQMRKQRLRSVPGELHSTGLALKPGLPDTRRR